MKRRGTSHPASRALVLRRGVALALVLGVLGVPLAAQAEPPTPSRADAGPDPVLAMFAGAMTETAGFVVGTALLGTRQGDSEIGRVGWVVMHSGFTLAPLAAHGVVGEWGRGLAFSAGPAACLAGTTGLFFVNPDAVDFASLSEQRVLWGLFALGLTTSVVGVIDAALVSTRGVKVAPSVTAHSTGLVAAGAF